MVLPQLQPQPAPPSRQRIIPFVIRALALAAWLASLQGISAAAASFLRFENQSQGIAGAPVYADNGVTRLGPPFAAQLWQQIDDAAAIALGTPTPFRAGSTAGFLTTTPAVSVDAEPGSVVRVQLRVWDSGLGATYAAAAAAGARSGVSPWFVAVTGTQASPGRLNFLETLTLAGDWDPPEVGVRALGDTPEGQTGITLATFELYLERTATAPVTVEWRTRDGTAIAGQDYRATNGVAVIPAGIGRVPFEVEVQGDSEPEDNETLEIEIVRVTRGVAPRPILGHLIRNDDPPTLLVSGSFPMEVTEGGTAVLRLRPSIPHLLGFSVTATTEDGTAKAQSDYLPVRTNFVLEGDIPRDLFVRVVTVVDDVPEPDEILRIRLSDPLGILLPSVPVYEILLRDSGPRPSLSLANTEVTRSLLEATRAEFLIRLSGPSAFPVTVDYATFDETATHPRDYTAQAGTVEFAPGETEKSVGVPIPAGASPAPLTFGLALSNPRNASLTEGRATATLRSIPLPSLRVEDLAIPEPATGTSSASVALRFTSPLPIPVSLQYDTRPLTATPGADYVPTAGRVELPAGATSAAVRIEILADTEVEATEAFAVALSDPDRNLFWATGTVTVFDAVTRDNPAAIDPSFDPSSGVGSTFNTTARVESLLLLPDRRILVGGWFNRFQDQTRNLLARLEPSGRLDPDFVPALSPGSFVRALTRTAEGSLIVGGAFSSGSPSLQNLAGLQASGALHPSFVARQANGWVHVALAMPDGRTLIGGEFTEIGGIPRPGIARLLPDGGVDPDFQPGTGVTSSTRARVEALALDSSGRIYLGGSFDAYRGTAMKGLARVRGNGDLDETFVPKGTLITVASALLVEPDGRILAGGLMTGGNLMRMLPDGSRDTTFGASPGMPLPTVTDGWVRAIARQVDGRILIGGAFQRVHGVIRTRLARLHGDGTLDPSFDPGSGADAAVHALAIQDDGGILVGGAFTNLCGVPRRGLGRLMGSPVPPPDNGAPPVLRVAADSTHLIVGWQEAPGFVLEGAEVLSGATTVWAPVAAPVETAGGESRARLVPEGTSRFFRVRRER